MSLLTETYAVPSTLTGVCRYLLRSKGQRDGVDAIERLLAPESLPLPSERDREQEEDDDKSEPGKKEGRKRVGRTVKECIAMSLFVEESGEVCLNPHLGEAARDPRTAEQLLPVTLVDLLFAAERDRNHDLGRAISWYLTQDALNAPGVWPDVEKAVKDQLGEDRLGLTNNARYGNFEDWVRFLGFGWMHVRGGKNTLTPDPTAHLRLRLAQALPGKPRTRHALPDVTNRLAQLCPVLEGGFLRADVERVLVREPGHLSSTTALAWLRLRDEGLVDLTQESDAATLLLPDGDRVEPVSHVVLLKAA